MTGIVLEGGGLRGMFTNGILDVFMQNGITFDALIGVSAGILFGINYKSRQPGRAYRYNIKYAHDKHYMSLWSLRTTGDFVNQDFAYHRLPYELDPFDFETFRQNPMPFWAVCTDIEAGKPVYHDIRDAEQDHGLDWMRATSSMPCFARPVEIDGHKYLDGGISDSIPLEFMHQQGYRRNVVILTQPTIYRKTQAHVGLPLRLFLHDYPKVREMMSVRHQMYNAELDYIEVSRQKGDTLIICPDQPLGIGRLEMNTDKMTAIYQQGREKALGMLSQVRDFLQ